MANRTNSASGTSKELTVQQKAALYEKNKKTIQLFESAKDAEKILRDVTKATAKSISTFDKEKLRRYIENIGANERNLRDVSRYLYYRSHIYFRLVRFYSSMADLRCRKVVPKYDLSTKPNKKSFLKNYNDTLDLLDRMNLQGNMQEVLERCFIDDVCYSIYFIDDTGSFFYILDPSYCKIDSRYMTGNLGFSVDMSYWNGKTRQQELEWLGEPLVSMYKTYKSTNVKWQHMPDEYAACFKFRMDDWQTVIPPFLSLFISLINLSDLEEIQAVADQQQIYKLIYLPMKTLSGSKESDDFQISPDILLEYFNRMLTEALPEYVAGAMVPGDELGIVDFSDNAASDTDRVEEAQTQILNTSGGGMVLNTSKITTTAGYEAALKMETEFALSSLLPQINGFANMILINKLGDRAAKVEHFEVSVYTKDYLKKDLLESCQYSFANRLAYNTLLGMSERDTIAMLYLENDVLGLPGIMKYPLASSFTSSGTEDGYTTEVGQGAPTKDASDLTVSGDQSRDE